MSFNRLAISHNTVSPAWWPYVSFTFLNPFRSNRHKEKAVRLRVLFLNVTNRAFRLPRPVRGHSTPAYDGSAILCRRSKSATKSTRRKWQTACIALSSIVGFHLFVSRTLGWLSESSGSQTPPSLNTAFEWRDKTELPLGCLRFWLPPTVVLTL